MKSLTGSTRRNSTILLEKRVKISLVFQLISFATWIQPDAELHLVAKTTPSPFVKITDQKSSRKKPILKGRKKNSNSNGRRIHMGSFDDFDSSGNDDDFSTTQIMGGSTLQEGHRTERPLISPSLPPPWVNINTANCRHHLVPITLFFPLFILTMIFVP